jgi:hypothetical protein
VAIGAERCVLRTDRPSGTGVARVPSSLACSQWNPNKQSDLPGTENASDFVSPNYMPPILFSQTSSTVRHTRRVEKSKIEIIYSNTTPLGCCCEFVMKPFWQKGRKFSAKRFLYINKVVALCENKKILRALQFIL